MHRAVLTSIVLALLASPAAAVPPAGAPPEIGVIADKLQVSFNSQDETTLADAFDSNVQAYINGKLVARDRGEWIQLVRDQFRRLNVKELDRSLSREQIISVQSVNDYPRHKSNIIVDCCFWARVVQYTLASNYKIETVRVFENRNGFWGTNQHPR